jgi:hypothetical protein
VNIPLQDQYYALFAQQDLIVPNMESLPMQELLYALKEPTPISNHSTVLFAQKDIFAQIPLTQLSAAQQFHITTDLDLQLSAH